jgi:hypothetical protein
MRRHNIGFWRKADSNTNVPFRGKSGHPKLKASHLLVTHFGYGPNQCHVSLVAVAKC